MTAPNSAYEDGATWASGPQPVYRRLAAHALDVLGSDLAGKQILDAGAGTGAMTLELLARGAGVVATDLSSSMLAELRRQTDGRVPTKVADIRELPFDDAIHDSAVAGFVVNHLAEPATAVAEMARVTKPGGVVLTTSFGIDDHPVKTAIEELLRSHGWTPPDWYTHLKVNVMPLTATVDAFATVGREAGLANIQVDAIDVEFVDLPPSAVAAYRLGMGHASPFVSALSEDERAGLVTEAEEAAAAAPALRLPLLVLHGVSRA
ncbi:MAG: demethylmenaquinone methyltransferase / 2-methoxy-6-polyprenyl,4-benzoquinol methylase [Frankiales bacterium]|jgi:ubiquinone/menaquinone biosynthesis C-methylase UbiE|nr:demethylmenaquinone methyltransferase / 2-methoxy-6-polyprenyl,4-benzoquinol methylase [Frankiales bacterium]